MYVCVYIYVEKHIKANSHTHTHTHILMGFLSGSAEKNLPANARDKDWIPGSGRSPGEGNGSLLQYSCLEIPWTEEPSGLQSMGSQKSWK